MLLHLLQPQLHNCVFPDVGLSIRKIRLYIHIGVKGCPLVIFDSISQSPNIFSIPVFCTPMPMAS